MDTLPITIKMSCTTPILAIAKYVSKNNSIVYTRYLTL